MGQGLSCRASHENGLFRAIQYGDLETAISLLERDPSVLRQTSPYHRESALHVAAAHGQMEILSFLLERFGNPDVLNRHKQTPLMFAAIHGKISCVQKLLEAGANILMFDSLRERTCLHHAAYHGHSDCVQAILSAAQSSPIAVSWGYARFVNIRDGKGATPLHLAARQRQPECVHILLDNGALVCASTAGYGFPGSTPLHLAAKGGSLDCIRELLAWGADRLQIDSVGRIPYVVALKHRHEHCAALLNPSSAGPLVWPSPLKLISELDQEAKVLLEQALMEANKKREKGILKRTAYNNAIPFSTQADGRETDDDGISEAGDAGLCSICFEQVCTIEVQDCGHQMCAQCTLALCCHNKPNPTTACLTPPVCPFCRSGIARLAVAKTKRRDEAESESREFSNSTVRKARKLRNLSEGSSSFKGLAAAGSFRRIGGRSSGRIAAEEDWGEKLLQWDDKPN